MAPVKFGLFKARSREHQEQPSTENLLQSGSDNVPTPCSPIPALRKAPVDMGPEESAPNPLLDREEEDVISEKTSPTRRASECSRLEDVQGNYQPLRNQASTDDTSSSTLQDEEFHDVQHIDIDICVNNGADKDGANQDGASTSCDANSLQFDQTSTAASEDLSVYCGTSRRPKKTRSREEQQIRDLDMWQSSNFEVMQNLLNRSGTMDEQIKWEAIATARGLCTLTDSCNCHDCRKTKYLASLSDGDGGLHAAPLFSAINVGCSVQ